MVSELNPIYNKDIMESYIILLLWWNWTEFFTQHSIRVLLRNFFQLNVLVFVVHWHFPVPVFLTIKISDPQQVVENVHRKYK